MLRAPMGKHGVEHRAEDQDTHHHAHPQAQVVQRLDALTHVGDAFAHIHGCGKGRVGGPPQYREHQAALERAGDRSHASSLLLFIIGIYVGYLSAFQLGQCTKLILTLPITVANGIHSLDRALPIALVGK